MNNVAVLPNIINSYKDLRGSIERFNLPNLEIRDILKIVSLKNSVRANHYHLKDYHVCLLTKGKMVYYERPVGVQDKPVKYFINAGDLFYTGPLIEHAMQFLEDSEFWCFSHLSREQGNYEEDTIRLKYDLTLL